MNRQSVEIVWRLIRNPVQVTSAGVVLIRDLGRTLCGSGGDGHRRAVPISFAVRGGEGSGSFASEGQMHSASPPVQESLRISHCGNRRTNRLVTSV